MVVLVFVVVVMIMAVAFAIVMVMLMVVIVVMAMTLPVMVMLMVVIVVMAVAFAVVVMVVMVVTVTFDVLIELVVESGVVDCVEHPVPELVLVNVENGAHECEVDLLLGFEGSVVLDTVLQVGQVESESGPVVECDRSLDVTKETSGLGLHPLSDGQKGLAEPGFGVGVVAIDLSGESDRASSGPLVLILVIVVVLAHCIIS